MIRARVVPTWRDWLGMASVATVLALPVGLGVWQLFRLLAWLALQVAGWAGTA